MSEWHYDEGMRWWSDGERCITDRQIAADPTLHPEYEPAKGPTTGEEVLGFAYGSDEAKRQRLDGELYYQAVDAILRAQRG